MPYVNHIAYTSKSINVSLFDLSQQLLQILKFRYWKGYGMEENYLQNLKLKIKAHLLLLYLPSKNVLKKKKWRGETHFGFNIKKLGGYMNCEHMRGVVFLF